VGGLVIDIFLGYFFRAISNWWRALGTKKWPSVEAIVTAHPIESSGYGGTKVEVVYSYRVQDELYTGMHTEPCFGSASEYMQRFPRGRRVAVRVKPGEPDVSVILDDDQEDGILKRLERIGTM
jgi:hypothetical protein